MPGTLRYVKAQEYCREFCIREKFTLVQGMLLREFRLRDQNGIHIGDSRS